MSVLNFIGQFDGPNATNAMSRDIVFAARAAGFDVKTDESEEGGLYLTTVQGIKSSLCRGRVVIMMWETDTLPPDVVGSLNSAKAVITISNWCADMFRDSGVSVPIHVIHPGFDSAVFELNDRIPLSEETIFTTVARIRKDRRKGIPELISAFLIAFPNRPDVTLRIKVGRDDEVPEISSSRIQFIRDELTPPQLALLYQTSSAYINSSFGEGFGLCPLEAMACGCPVISTYWGGVTDFLELRPQNFIKVKHTLAQAGSFGPGRWARFDIFDMANAMLMVAKNRKWCQLLGYVAAKSITSFTRARMIQKYTAFFTKHAKLLSCR